MPYQCFISFALNYCYLRGKLPYILNELLLYTYSISTSSNKLLELSSNNSISSSSSDELFNISSISLLSSRDSLLVRNF